ncbi:hypothetical protein C440_07112 [Haloferax mucosum ATCC BAA-1512]|uniref:Small CPxCG-related zinc finger protein n=1 Tax=Haloferax mucosum ATCC BAA-1512 TaxID=662479 RepID=M0IDG6_9EURY|nr:hypothetical protein [Haloferax mucosum]ELZ94825.1 hypothetical protein C440_07112 [Haloferax mucosum ATCC BAA-1512]
MLCEDCGVEMYRTDDEKRTDLEDRRVYECPDCGVTKERAKYRHR